MAIGALANKIEADFERYMPHFAPYLVLGLRNPKEYQVCTVAVGVVGDVCRAIEAKMVPFCDDIFVALFQNLQVCVTALRCSPSGFYDSADVTVCCMFGLCRIPLCSVL